jgi:hypothetical protein
MVGKIHERLFFEGRETGSGRILQVKTICRRFRLVRSPHLKQGLEESSDDKDMFSVPINFDRASWRSERIDKQKGE